MNPKISVISKLIIPIICVFLLFIGGINAGVITFEAPKKQLDGEITATIKIDFGDGNSFSKTVNLINATVYESLLDLEEIEIKSTYWKQYDSYFVDSITYQGIKYESDSSHFWGFYINGNMAIQGADKTFVENEDLIEWRYETF